MRQALASKSPRRQQISAVKSFPAPVGGWNARDALAAMKPTDAIALENLFPTTSYVESRGGYANHATGMTGTGKTLAVYNAMSGSNKMFGFTESGIYNVTSAGAVGASGLARTNGKHQWVNFGDGTTNYLIACNGVDAPGYYDGATWTAVTGATSPALTGLTTTEIISVFVFKGRLIFIQKASLSFWYLAAGAAGGALTEFDLSAEAPAGGFLMAGAAWTMDGGDGIDDYAVFVTSEGEVIVYRGTNPSAASTWAKVGSYVIGKPLGRRCLTKYGGDIIVLTQNGAFPMSAALPFASVDSKLALSFKIENAFNTAARSYINIFGWKAILYPNKSAFIVNVPIAENGEHEQYVMNTITKAWCKFNEWDAEDFAILNGDLYFTRSTVVVKAWTGTIDGTSDIVLYGKTAFNYFGNQNQQKLFKMFRPVMAINGTFAFLTDIDVDFQDNPITGTATYSVISGASWDVDSWDVGYWAAGLEIVKEWTSPDEYEGYCAAGKIKITTHSLIIQWMSYDMLYETGGVL
jgi:hypothetical protein